MSESTKSHKILYKLPSQSALFPGAHMCSLEPAGLSHIWVMVIGGSPDGPVQENLLFHEYIVNISKHADI